MRFGQLSVQDMVPDITRLTQARQVKDQAFQNIAGTVMQFAADKEKKELQKKEEKRGIAAITPFLEDLAKRNPALRNIDPKDFYKAHGKNALPELGKYMQASSLQYQAKARLQEQLNEQKKQEVLQNTSAVTQKLEQQFGIKGRTVTATELRNAVSSIASEFNYTNFDPNNAVLTAFNNIQAAGKLEGEAEVDIVKVQKGISNTVTQFMTQESIIDSAREVYTDLREIIGNKASIKEEQENIKKTMGNYDPSEVSTALSKLTGTKDEIIAEGYAYFASLLKGTGASAFQQKLSALAGRIANSVLQGTRANSADGSSGYGQLTGPELTLLKNFYGSLLTEGGSLANFEVIQTSLERIMREIPESASRQFETASNEYGTKRSLGYSPERARKEMLEQLRSSPGFELFDLQTFKPFDIQSFINNISEKQESENNNNSTTGNTSTLSSLFRTEPTVSSFSQQPLLLSDPPRGDAIYSPYQSSPTGTSSMITPVPQAGSSQRQNSSVDLGRNISVVNSKDGLMFSWESE